MERIVEQQKQSNLIKVNKKVVCHLSIHLLHLHGGVEGQNYS